MIVTEKKPFEEILEALKGKKKIFIIGCGECATTCKTGGEREVLWIKGELEKEGKVVTGWAIPDAPCISAQTRMAFAKNRASIEESEAFLVLACGLGAQSVQENDRIQRPTYIGLNTIFGSILDKSGLVLFERCAMCAECVLNLTGGICPISRCPKGLLNGPCGGTKGGKCEVDRNKDCAWLLIYKRHKELGTLDNMKVSRPPKDYSKLTRPHEIVIK